MNTAAAVLVGVVIGGLAVRFVLPLLAPGEEQMTTAECEAVVQLSFDGTTIHAYPEKVCLAKGRPLTWAIVGPGEVEINFETKNNKKGPFPHDPQNNPHNKKERGNYKRETTDISKKVISNPAELIDRWKYSVKWTPPGGPPTTLDPVVCIRK